MNKWALLCHILTYTTILLRARNSAERGAREVQCGWAYFGANLPLRAHHNSAIWPPGGLMLHTFALPRVRRSVRVFA